MKILGLLKWVGIAAGAAVLGPLVVPLMLSGDMSGIDGYSGDCGDE